MQQTITKYLNKQGQNPHGRPLYRLSWSDNQYEKRSGSFNEFYGDIFVRTFVGTTMVKKYPYIHERWILEIWFPPEMVIREELPDSRFGSYEPIYVFEDSKGESLPLSLRVVELIVNYNSNPRKPVFDSEETLKEKEIKRCEDEIDTSYIQNALHLHEAIVVPERKTNGRP